MADILTRIVNVFLNTGSSQRSLKELTAESNKLNNELRRMTPGTQEFVNKSKQLQSVQKEIKNIRNEIAGTNKDVSAASNVLGGFKGAMLAAFSIATIVGFTQKVVAATARVQSITASFETMLKSKEKTDRLMMDLQEFASTTPFQLTEIQEATKKLLAFGSSASEIKGELKSLGDISAGVGAPIGEIAELYGKARVQGRLFAEDINQLTGRGIPIIQELAKQFGVAEGRVKKLVEDGQVGFPHLQKAFSALTAEGGKFFNLMENQSKTVGGQISNLEDQIDAIITSFGSANSGTISNVVGFFARLAENIGKLIIPTESATGKLEDLRSEFNSEMEVLKRGNFTQEQRARLIGEINSKYGEYLPQLISEKASLEEIEKAQKAVNDQLLGKILLIDYEKELEAIYKKQKESAESLYQVEKARTASRTGGVEQTAAQVAAQKTLFENLDEMNKTVVENTDKDIQAVEDKYKAMAENLGLRFETLKKQLNAVPASTSAETIDEKAEKELQKLLEKWKKFNHDVAKLDEDTRQLGLDKMDADIAKSDEKYNEMLYKAKEFQGKKAISEKEYQNTIDKIINDRELARNAIRAKYAADEVAEREKLISKVAVMSQEGVDREIEEVRQKYAELIKEAQKYGLDVSALVAVRENEISAIRKKQAEKDLKEIEEEKKKRLEIEMKTYAALGLMVSQYSDLVKASSEFIEATGIAGAKTGRTLALVAVTLDTAKALSATIAGATKAAAETPGPQFPFVLAGYIASGLATVLSAYVQVNKLLAKSSDETSSLGITGGGGPKGLSGRNVDSDIGTKVENLPSGPQPGRKTFAFGGDTGPGFGLPDNTGYKQAGIVHENEYVIPESLRQDPEVASMEAVIEAKRLKMYATGGPVSSSVSAPPSGPTPTDLLLMQLIAEQKATRAAFENWNARIKAYITYEHLTDILEEGNEIDSNANIF